METGLSAPVFSVIVPTFTRPAALRRCLLALAAQTFRQPYEVIVVNDGGPPLTSADLAPGSFMRLLVLNQDNAGPAAARNLGSEHATGTFLAFTDDDCEPAADWLDQLAKHLEIDSTAMVGGHTANLLTENICAAASQLLIDFLYDFFRVGGMPRFFTSNNMAVTRQEFLDAGRFDDGFPLPAAEDRELCSRWRNGGRQTIYAPTAIVRHSHEMNLAKFMRQQFRYGRGAWLLREKGSRRGEKAPPIEPLSFYGKMLYYPFHAGQGNFARRCTQSGLFLISQIVHTAGFFRERWWPFGNARRPRVEARTELSQ